MLLADKTVPEAAPRNPLGAWSRYFSMNARTWLRNASYSSAHVRSVRAPRGHEAAYTLPAYAPGAGRSRKAGR